jgi:esterase/lipase superfamily enzyme
MQEFYHKWYSQYINREFEMLVFGTGGIPVIFFPPPDARYYSLKDNGVVSSLLELLNNGMIKLYCPDTYDSESWYHSSAAPYDKVNSYKYFENLIIHDIIGFTRYETQYEKAILAGADFGGYHALNFALKHPDMVSGIISINGFFNIKQFIGHYYDDECYFNNPLDYLPGLNDEWYIEKIKKMEIHLISGEFFHGLTENHHISSLLNSKEIKNNFRVVKSVNLWDICKENLSQVLADII